MKLVAKYTLDIYLVKGKIYDGELTPTMYDPNTFQPAKPHYIIKCDDGKFRKFMAEHFITLEEWREKQLEKLL
jgi:hypothetical protein